MRVLEITVDNCCFDKTGKHPAGMETLLEWHAAGYVDLIITSTVDLEASALHGDYRRRVEALLSGLTMDRGGEHVLRKKDPLRFDSGRYRGGNGIGLDSRWTEILDLVFGVDQAFSGRADRRDARFRDAQILETHRRNQRDLFLTCDTTILNKAEDLKSRFGIAVAKPEDAVRTIKTQWGGETPSWRMGGPCLLLGTNCWLGVLNVPLGGDDSLWIGPVRSGQFTVPVPCQVACNEQLTIRSTGVLSSHSEDIATSGKPFLVPVAGTVFSICGPLYGPGGARLGRLTPDEGEVCDPDTAIVLIVGFVPQRMRLAVRGGLYREVVVYHTGRKLLDLRVLQRNRVRVLGTIYDADGNVVLDCTKTGMTVRGSLPGMRAEGPQGLGKSPFSL